VSGGVVRGLPLRPGDPQQLGKYRLLRRLGEGGMGSVYLADSPEGRTVALKVIRADLAEQPEFRRRFRGEVARAQEVPPFCTAEVLDADPDHETPFLVVEYVDGPSLSEVVLDRGPLTPANLYGLAIGVATALTAIHGAGVIHRDLKPSNVLLAPGTPKVIDFGIARGTERSDGDTRTDQLLGTVAYMAPERLDPSVFGQDSGAMPGGVGAGGVSGSTGSAGLAVERINRLTPAADVFAWGAVVAFAATGHVPFLADSPPATAVAILTLEPTLDGITGPLRDLVAQALSKRPEDRPTARQLLDRLLTTGQDTQTSAPRPRDAQLAAGGATESSLLKGMERAYVAATREMPVFDDRTDAVLAAASGPFDDPDDYDPLPPPRHWWRALSVAALVLVVLGSAAIVVGMATGYIRPSAHAGTTPTSAPSPTATLSYLNITHNGLRVASASGWRNASDRGLGACTVGIDGLTVQLPNDQTYRCPGQVANLADLRASVNVTLMTPTSCAGIWFRFDNQHGYALQVCPNDMRIVSHSTRITTLLDHTLDRPIAPYTPTKIEIDVVGQNLQFYRDGELEFSYYDYHNTYRSGHVVLGAFQEKDGALPEIPETPYAVRFDTISVDQIVP
jgi:serine/threonine protein kinase